MDDKKNSKYSWIKSHDDQWWFSMTYIVLALILSIWISIFWLSILVGLHALLEWKALKIRGVNEHLGMHVFWHLKLDIMLVILALTVGVYLEVIMGALGLGYAVRAGVQVGSRALALQQIIQGAAVSIDEAALAARALWKSLMKKNKTEVEEVKITLPWREKWSWGDKMTFVFTGFLIMLILGAPLWTDHTMMTVIESLGQSLNPWPRD